jgi:polyhydroxyalkanoate synthesis regulator phasin
MSMYSEPKDTYSYVPYWYSKNTVYSISNLKRSVGFTDDQVRKRLKLLLPAFADDCKEVCKGEILVGHQTLTALRRIEDLEKEGLSPNDAARQVMQELLYEDKTTQTIVGQRFAPIEQAFTLEVLRTENMKLRQEIERLHNLIQELTRSAVPRHRRWLQGLIISSVRRNQAKEAAERINT